MSRFFIYMTLFLAPVFAGAQSLPLGTELLTDNGFESGTGNWNIDWGGIASLNTAAPLAGTASLRLSAVKGGLAQAVFGVEAGATYRISGLAKLAANGDVATIGVNFENSAGTVVLAQWIQVLSTAAQAYSFDVVAPAGITTVQVYPFKNSGNQPADFDNLSMMKIANP